MLKLFTPIKFGPPTLLAAALAVCLGCFYSGISHSHMSGSNTVGGRTVAYDLDGGGKVQTSLEPPATTIRFVRGTVSVEHDRVLLDGAVIAKIVPTAKSIEVVYADGQLSVTSDGNRVFAKQLASVDEPAGTYSE